MASFMKWMSEKTEHELTEVKGELGYLVTLSELIDHGGRDEFFRKTRRQSGTFTTSRHVYHGLEYDKESRAWYAGDYEDSCEDSGPLKKSSVVFVGFTY